MRCLLIYTLACLLTGLPISAQAGTTQSWHFKVYLDNSQIGQHTFNVTDNNKIRYVKVNADFNVKVLFFNAYKYTHENQEVWQGQCISSIYSITDDNGNYEYVKGKQREGTLELDTSAGKKELNGCIKTFAYWDPKILDSHNLLNSQTGELMPVDIENLGTQVITVRNNNILSQHYRIKTKKFSIDLWYSPSREWLALQSKTSNGTVLRYQLQ